MRPGMRVVRGPDWDLGNIDGGAGSLGTVVNLNDPTLVQWDNGNVTKCSAGQNNKADLRLFDNAQIGMVFRSVNCDECKMKGLQGMRWKCLLCRDYDLCTACYMAGKHDLTHDFVRYTTTRSCVVKMPCRKKCEKVTLRGILPGAVVRHNTTGIERPVGSSNDDIKQTDTLKSDMADELGEVIEVTDVKPVSYRGGCLVHWNSGKSGKYCVGGDGKVDIFATQPAEGGSIYFSHLPELDVTASVESTINLGDEVRCDLNIDTLKFLQKEHGGWTDEMENILGEIGTVEKIDGATINVKYKGSRPWFLYANVLIKVSNPTVGDTVTVIVDVDKLKGLQNYHGGVTDAMLEAAGGLGKVLKVHPTGELLVKTSKGTFLFNPSCCVLSTGEIYKTEDTSNEDTSNEEEEGQAIGRTRISGLEIDVGVRVLRGPDWKWQDQDGGEGGLGTVIEVGKDEGGSCPTDCVMIQWDNGTRNSYRAGYEDAYDLRLFDTATMGIKHHLLKCSGCESNGIFGTLWTCSSCPDVNMCSLCYTEDKHDIDHPFKRIDMQGHEGILVPKRRMSRKKKVSGIFEGATVIRGLSWRWENQDGGEGRSGVVLGIVNFTPDTDHDGAEVLWETHITNVYRLGFKGDVDLKCKTLAFGGFYYRDHLKTLRYDDFCQASKTCKQLTATGGGSGAESGEKSNAASSDSLQFESGDRVRIEIDVDVLKMIQENHGGWDDHIVECIGKIGRVFHADEKEVIADFGSAGKWMFHEAALTKVKKFQIGDVVLVSDNLTHVRAVQERRAQWSDKIPKLMGRIGEVRIVEEDGDVQLSFGDVIATFNPDCLTQTSRVPDYVDITSEGTAPVSQKDSEKSDSSKPEVNSGVTVSLQQSELRSKTAGSIDSLKDNEMHMENRSSVQPDRNTNEGVLFGESSNSYSQKIITVISRQDEPDQKDVSELHVSEHVVPQQEQETVLARTQKLFGAIMKNDVELSQSLIQSWPSLANQIFRGKTAMHVASHQGKEEIVKLFLSQPGVRIDDEDDEKITPFLAAVKGNQLKIASMFLEKGAKIDVINSNGQTALHLAAQSENLQCLILLIENGCKLNATDRLGDTAVIDAIQTGNQECIKILIQQKDIDLTSKNLMGFAAIHFAARKGELQAVKHIIARNAELVNSAKPDGYTALHLAACNDHEEIVNFFLQQSEIELDTTNSLQQTPLMSACIEGSFEIVKQLVDHGADKNFVDEGGNNCLHLVLMSKTSIQEMKRILISQNDELLEEEAGRVKIAVYLIQHGVSCDKKNNRGESPLEAAASERIKQTVMQVLQTTGKMEAVSCDPHTMPVDGSGYNSVQSAPENLCSVTDCDGTCHLLLNPCGHRVCLSCGKTAKFCPECGHRIESRQQLAAK